MNWHFVFWGALGPRNGGYNRLMQPAVCIGMTTAAVFEALWISAFSVRTKREISAAFGMKDFDACRWLAFFSSLRMIGMITPQKQYEHGLGRTEMTERLEALGYMNTGHVTTSPDFMTYMILRNEIFYRQPFGFCISLRDSLARVLSGYSGPAPSGLVRKDEACFDWGDDAWIKARFYIALMLANHFKITGDLSPMLFSESSSKLIAGLFAVTDKVVANWKTFPFSGSTRDRKSTLTTEAYWTMARLQAASAVERLGFDSRIATPRLTVEQAFHGNAAAATVFTSATAMLSKNPDPFLLIVESPVGGRAAALTIAIRQHSLRGSSGIYYAVPAVTVEAVTRFQRFLDPYYRTSPAITSVVEDDPSLQEIVDTFSKKPRFFDEKSPTPAIVQSCWHERQLRSWLGSCQIASFAQTFAAPDDWAPLAHFSKACRTLVIDGLRMSDIEASNNIERELQSLAAARSSVIIVTDGLSSQRTAALCQAYGGGLGRGQTVPHIAGGPRITIVSSVRCESTHVRQISSEPIRTQNVQTGWLVSDHRLVEELASEGTSVVICESPSQAQHAYRELASRLKKEQVTIDLWHSQMVAEELAERTISILARFGVATDQSVQRAVLVCTPELLRNSDLRFDRVVTELVSGEDMTSRRKLVRPTMTLGAGTVDTPKPQMWIGLHASCSRETSPSSKSMSVKSWVKSSTEGASWVDAIVVTKSEAEELEVTPPTMATLAKLSKRELRLTKPSIVQGLITRGPVLAWNGTVLTHHRLIILDEFGCDHITTDVWIRYHAVEGLVIVNATER